MNEMKDAPWLPVNSSNQTNTSRKIMMLRLKNKTDRYNSRHATTFCKTTTNQVNNIYSKPISSNTIPFQMRQSNYPSQLRRDYLLLDSENIDTQPPAHPPNMKPI